MQYPSMQLSPESDLIEEMIEVRKEIKLTFIGGHVKSHQSLKDNETIPLEVDLNDDCDEQANQLFLHGDSSTTHPANVSTITEYYNLHSCK